MSFVFPQLVHRVFNNRLMVTPAKAAVLFGVLESRASWDATLSMGEFGGEAIDKTGLKSSLEVAPRLRHAMKMNNRDFPEVENVAVIRIRGTLVHDGGLDPVSGMTGYDGISEKLDQALACEDIRGIVLDINSPGGEVDGCFDLAEQIYKVSKQKPIWAICASHAYSAAYALASQANRIIVPDCGGVGSVGVVIMHTDISQLLSNQGVEVTLIHAGAHKVDGTPHRPLSEEVQSDLQVSVDKCRVRFAELVARGRDISVKDVLDTEAGCFDDHDAVKVKFADAVMAPDKGLAAFLSSLDGNPIDI